MSLDSLGTRRPAWILAIGLLFLIGAWLRFHALEGIELFVDEGGHLLVPVDDDVRRSIDPIAEGKPAMLWFFRPTWELASDPLIAARAMVGFCGLLTAAAIGATLWSLFGRTAAVIGSALWLLLPFTVFHERLALFDPLVATLVAGGVAVITCGNRVERSPTQAVVWTFLGSLLAGAAALQKISAVMAGPWLLLVFFAVQRRCGRSLASWRLVAALGAFVLPALCLWLTAPGFGERVLSSNATAIRADPFSFLSWSAGYGGFPLLILVVYAVVVVGRRKEGVIACFGVAALLALIVSSLVYRRPHARYAHPDYVPLVIFIAAAVGSDPRRFGLTLSAVACLRWGYFDLQIISNPTAAPLPAGEIEQYVTGFWSGSGSSRTVRFIEQHAPCVVIVHRYSRPASYAVLLAARRNPLITVVPLSLEISGALDAAKTAAARKTSVLGSGGPVYLLAEGTPPFEPMALAAAGIPYRIVFENMKNGETARVIVLECDFTRSSKL